MSTMTTPPNPLPPTEQPVANISIQDLQNYLLIMDMAAQRGAFKGPELSQVGAVFDKLKNFIQSVVPPETPADVPQMSQVHPSPPPSVAPKPLTPMAPPFSPKVGV